METRIRIVEVREGHARIAGEGAHGCGACGPAGCHPSWPQWGRPRDTSLPAQTQCGQRLQAGQAATLVLPEGELLRAVARAYLPMLAGMVAAPLLTRLILDAGDGVVLAVALAGGLGGWFVARRWLAERPPEFTILRDEDVPAA